MRFFKLFYKKAMRFFVSKSSKISTIRQEEFKSFIIRCIYGYGFKKQIKPYYEISIFENFDQTQGFYTIDKYEFISLLVHRMIYLNEDDIPSFHGTIEDLMNSIEHIFNFITILKNDKKCYDYYESIYRKYIEENNITGNFIFLEVKNPWERPIFKKINNFKNCRLEKK